MLKHEHILLLPCFSAGTFHSVQLVGYVLYQHESSNGFPVGAEIISLLLNIPTNFGPLTHISQSSV